MPVFRSIVFAAALAGLLAGLLLTIAQQLGTVPLILEGRGLRAGGRAGGCRRRRWWPGTITPATSMRPGRRRTASSAPPSPASPTSSPAPASRSCWWRASPCAAGPIGWRAGPVLGPGRVRGLHAGAVPRPAAGAARDAGGRARPAPGLVAAHGRWRLPPAWRCWPSARLPSGRWRRSLSWWCRISSARRSRSIPRRWCPETLAHRFVVAVTVTSFLFWVGLGRPQRHLLRALRSRPRAVRCRTSPYGAMRA